jgi:hypothetical protein
VLDLPCLDQRRHRTDRFLDRRVRVDAVLVIEVDVLDVQALQRRIDRGAHVLGAAVDRARSVVEPAVAELRGEHVLVAPAGDRASDQFSFAPWPYTSAVSRKVSPSSSARWIVAIDSWSSVDPYHADIPMQPSPCSETTSPCVPTVRFSTSAPSSRVFPSRSRVSGAS